MELKNPDLEVGVLIKYYTFSSNVFNQMTRVLG